MLRLVNGTHPPPVSGCFVTLQLREWTLTRKRLNWPRFFLEHPPRVIQTPTFPQRQRKKLDFRFHGDRRV